MTHLEPEFRGVLARLELISHGATQSWNSDGRGGFDQLYPPGESDPPHLFYRRLWEKFDTDEWRQSVLKRARDELKALTRRDAPAVSPLSEREIMVQNCLEHAGKGYTSVEVAARFRYTVRQVRAIWVADGRDAERGEQIVDLSRADWAASLAELGLSQAQIAERMGVSQPTVHRLLKFRRASAA